MRSLGFTGWALGAAVALALNAGARAGDYYVDHVAGNDSLDGSAAKTGTAPQGPFRTVARAIKAAGAGDTIHLNPASGRVYRETADFYGHTGGKPGAPLTLDGHGAMLSGAEPCPPDGWQPWTNGVLVREDLPAVMLVVDGRLVFQTGANTVLAPGEACYSAGEERLFFKPVKGRQHGVEVGQPDGSAVALDPAKWQNAGIPDVVRYNGLKAPAWVKIDGQAVTLVRSRERLAPGGFCAEGRRVYYRPPVGKSPKDLQIEAVVRGNGVQMSGNTAHVVVRNLNAQHVYNDGFNIHGHVTHAEFYNCNARQCGDEGFSAHDACETVLDGAVYEDCDNGIANVNTAGFSVTRRVILRAARSVGYLLQGAAWHTLEDAILIDNPTQLSGGGVTVSNVLIVGTSTSRWTQALGCSATSTLRRVTVAAPGKLLHAGAGALVRIEDSLFASAPGVIHVRADDPFAVVRLARVAIGSGIRIEWGSQYPWKTPALKDWLAQAESKGAAVGVTVGDSAVQDDLMQRRAPAGLPDDAGCSRELIRRYVEYMKQSAAP